MVAKLSTTINKIQKLSNSFNAKIVYELNFYNTYFFNILI
jgi:hypothetical protein